MNTYEIIKELAKEKKLSIRQLEIDFGYSNGYLSKWRNNTPNADELSKLADYFDVSVDYLLGREEKTQYASDDLEEMIDNAMSFNGKPLSDHDREVARAYLEGKFGTK